MDAPVRDASTFRKNRERLLAAVVGQPRVRAPMSSEHPARTTRLAQSSPDQFIK